MEREPTALVETMCESSSRKQATFAKWRRKLMIVDAKLVKSKIIFQLLEALRWKRSSVGYRIYPSYYPDAKCRLQGDEF